MWIEEAVIKPVADDFNKYALRTKATLSAEYPAQVITGQRASGVDPQFPLHASLCLLYTAITAKRLLAPVTAGRRENQHGGGRKINKDGGTDSFCWLNNAEQCVSLYISH